MKATPIPTKSRELVRQRAKGRCERCGGKGREWHHRRSRSVRDNHTHCPCNGIYLCGTCHRWAHREPIRAREVGCIIERAEWQPWQAMVQTTGGWVRFTCEGGVMPVR